MKKWLFWVLLAIIVAISGTYGVLSNKAPDRLSIAILDVNQDGKAEYEISLQHPKQITLVKSGEHARASKLETEKTFVYTARENNREVGTATVTLRQTQKRDYIYLLKYQPKQAAPAIEAVITALGGSNRISGHQIIYEKSISNTTSKFVPFTVKPGLRYTLAHKLPRNAVFLDSASHYLRLGLIDVYRPLQNHVRVELYEKSPQIAVQQSGDNIDYTLPLPQEAGCFAETWGILSSSALVAWNNPKALSNAKTGDLVRYRKLASDGIYYLTPSNYYPTAQTAFWPNPGYHVAELFRKQSGGVYFRDISITSMYMAIAAQTDNGYWLTYPRSDWLFRDYGVPEGFYDTRFNTDAALFLLNMYKKYGDETALKSAQKCAGWLRSYVINQGIATTGGGMLVPDYAKPGVTHKKTHVSLNHLVTEMNFLYKLYLVDHDPRNLKTAAQIRQAVRDTGEAWIMPNGDLYYAYMGNGKYGMPDYPLITLKDLRLSQQLIREIDRNPRGDDVFGNLIKAKETFLQKQNLPIE